MNKVTARILETQTVTDEQGQTHPLVSHTSLEQCEFIQKIISEIGAKTTLEVGLGYGMSALSICEALEKQEGASHYIMADPQEPWNQIGFKNLKDAGYEHIVNFKYDYSHNVLPELLIFP